MTTTTIHNRCSRVQMLALVLFANALLTICTYAQTTAPQDSSSATQTTLPEDPSQTSQATLPDDPAQASETAALQGPAPVPATAAQEPAPVPAAAVAAPPQNEGDLNLFKGQIVMQPPESERFLGPQNVIRKTLKRYGFGIYDTSQTSFVYNTISPPVPLAAQTYTGQRPTWSVSEYPALTYDMRAFHIKNGQLLVMGSIQRNSWYPAGPEATGFGTISYYQSLFKNRLEVKLGYLDNAEEFVQMRVGGLASNGSLGVYAVLPYENGMANLPQQAPGANVRVNLPHHFYTKVGFQRSFDANGGVGEQARDSLQLRFAPKGDGLLTIYELDYQKSTFKNPMETWIRGGFMYNTTHYTNFKTNAADTTNHIYYLLGDRQLFKTDAANPRRGLFAGFTGMYTPPTVNRYTQYYEFRLYDNGPFSKRPRDFVSFVASHTDFSEFYTRGLVSSGHSALNSSTSATVTYTARITRGMYFVNAMGYTQGPAITPRTRNSLNYNTMLNIFF